MDVFPKEQGFLDMHMIEEAISIFENDPHMKTVVKYGPLGIEYVDSFDLDDYDGWTASHESFEVYHDFDSQFIRSHMTPRSEYHPSAQYISSLHMSPCLTSKRVQPKESDSERKARILLEEQKIKEKAEKKRLKKQRQKQKKEMEKKKQNPVKSKEDKDEVEKNKAVVDQDEDKTESNGKLGAAAKDVDSETDKSEQESSEEDANNREDFIETEELDLTSSFVSKAAQIAKRQLVQKPKAEKKKKILMKEQRKSEKQEVVVEPQRKDCVVPSKPTIEDNVKISTELAILGNKIASSGDFSRAVRFFTDAIKYNPKEYKLFGNRSYCFEKLQEYDKALTDAELSLGICPGWVKGLFRKGRALAGLKRYEEAAEAFKDVLKLDGCYAEAAQELMRVQIIQLMSYGFTREQSANALIIHGTFNKAFEVLSSLNQRPGTVVNDSLAAAQAVNVSGVSPILSAATSPAHAYVQTHNLPKTTFPNKPLVANVPLQSKPVQNNQPPDFFPVWVGNLFNPVTEAAVTNLFSKAGFVHSVKILQNKCCAFVNFTKQECCDEAIRRFHGHDLSGNKLAVRYPDRIFNGIRISKATR